MRRKPRGFTLVEVILAGAISVIVAAAASPAIFQVMTGTERNNNRLTAVRQVQQAGSWVSRDALRASTLTVSAGNGFPITMTWGKFWPDDDGNYTSGEHTVTYTLVSGTFQRQETSVTTIYDDEGEPLGDPTTINARTLVAEYLTDDTRVSLEGGILKLTVTARFPLTSPRYAAEETRTYDIKPRPQK